MIKYDDSKNTYNPVCDGLANMGYKEGFKAAAEEANAEIERLKGITEIILNEAVFRCPPIPKVKECFPTESSVCLHCWLEYAEKEASIPKPKVLHTDENGDVAESAGPLFWDD